MKNFSPLNLPAHAPPVKLSAPCLQIFTLGAEQASANSAGWLLCRCFHRVAGGRRRWADGGGISLTIRRVLECVCVCVNPCDWFTSQDLKDSFFHISVLLRHRRFLYQNNQIPSSYSLALQVYGNSEAIERDRGFVLLRQPNPYGCLPVDSWTPRSASHTASANTGCSLLPFQLLIYLGVEIISGKLSPAKLSIVTHGVPHESTVTDAFAGYDVHKPHYCPFWLLYELNWKVIWLLLLDPVQHTRQRLSIPPSLWSTLPPIPPCRGRDRRNHKLFAVTGLHKELTWLNSPNFFLTMILIVRGPSFYKQNCIHSNSLFFLIPAVYYLEQAAKYQVTDLTCNNMLLELLF